MSEVLHTPQWIDRPIRYITMRVEYPMPQLGDMIHTVNTKGGSGELRLSDMRRVMAELTRLRTLRAQQECTIRSLEAEAADNARRLAEQHEEIRALRAELAAKDEEIADLRCSVVAFGAVWAVDYAANYGLPRGHLHPTHYDILAKAGARMEAFTRAVMPGGGDAIRAQSGTAQLHDGYRGETAAAEGEGEPPAAPAAGGR